VQQAVRGLIRTGPGTMTARPRVSALPWYHRGDYPALLLLFSDPDKVPNTFDAWLEHAESVERQLQAAGFVVERAWIRPGPFAAWCRERDLSPNQQARLQFANETARQHHPRP
jgi:hypothetical protein